ncbi:MAG: hypothetical protein KKA07_16690, partial [Bacteroidetes bacterium]|nr:hypothetical protein [Bacteroidota bacterium]
MAMSSLSGSISRLLLAALLGFMVLPLWCQPKVSSIDFLYSDQKLNITFEISSYNAGDVFRPELMVFKENGERISATAYKIDDNQTTVSGGKHLIVWDMRKDGVVLNQKVYVSVEIKQNATISLSRHLVKSALLPGLGNYRLANGKHYYLYSVVGYGLAAGAIGMNYMAGHTFEDYRNTYDASESDALYKQAKNQDKLSYVMAVGAVVAWAVDFYTVVHRYKKVKSNINPQTSKYYFEQNNIVFQGVSPAHLVDNRNAYDLAMESGVRNEKSGDIYAARTDYENALKQKPDDAIAEMKLKAVNTAIAQKEAEEKKYNDLIVKADAQFNSKSLDLAKSLYQQALEVFPQKSYPKDQLEAIARIETGIANQKKYDDLIKNAEQAMLEGKYEQAVSFFHQAGQIKPDESRPKTGQKEAELKINEGKFDALMADGNKALEENKYDLARKYYEQALAVFPSNPLAQSKLSDVKTRIAQIAEAENTK